MAFHEDEAAQNQKHSDIENRSQAEALNQTWTGFGAELGTRKQGNLGGGGAGVWLSPRAARRA
ncbi:hypothetical protein E2C01_073915 [Portunus trituberculatus]|uniref:Uncharacterized protein n=1 Tax=Portunus trituberculatus TaxID=210409 RepID=A0A5B7IBY3_PORTR|nr:hypothetical protein [Portunus trituberculatus]